MNLWGYEIDTGRKFQITNTPYRREVPVLSDNNVFWYKTVNPTSNELTGEVFMADISNLIHLGPRISTFELTMAVGA